MREHQNMVSAIRHAYDSASEAQRVAGEGWYPRANELAHETFGEVTTGSGIIAALSPLTPWTRNLELARMAASGTPADELPTLGTARKSVARILAGENWRDVLAGPKIRAFAECIETGGDCDAVCVDRHARDIAYGESYVGMGHKRPEQLRIGVREYRDIAAAYVDAAQDLEVSPATLQAVTWTAQRPVLDMV